MLTYSKLKKLTNSIQNNCSTNKNILINNIYHYQSCKITFSTLPIIAFRKGISLKQTIGNDSLHNIKKLIKTKNNHHTGKCVPCDSTCCLCCQQIISTTTFKIIKAIKHLKSALESTIEAAWLFIYYNALFVTFNMLVNQKHHQHLAQ